MAIIKRNIEAFKDPEDAYFQHDILKTEVADEWITRHAIAKLPYEFSLFKIQHRVHT